MSFHAQSAPPTGGATLRRVPTTRKPKLPLPISNRIPAILLHIPWNSVDGAARLAEDVGVSRSTISRLIRGQTSPSYRLARAITDALSRRSDITLDMREVFSTNGTYPTDSVCCLMNCPACLPPEAWDEQTHRLKPEWREAIPGDWSHASKRCPAAGISQ